MFMVSWQGHYEYDLTCNLMGLSCWKFKFHTGCLSKNPHLLIIQQMYIKNCLNSLLPQNLFSDILICEDTIWLLLYMSTPLHLKQIVITSTSKSKEKKRSFYIQLSHSSTLLDFLGQLVFTLMLLEKIFGVYKTIIRGPFSLKMHKTI